MIGKTLDHYRILGQLGAGGMGVVYRARDEKLERDVALKVLPAGALSDDAARKRFRQEALALSQLNHPNICSIYEIGEAEGQTYIVMEYVDGRRSARRSAQAVWRWKRRSATACKSPRRWPTRTSAGCCTAT